MQVIFAVEDLKRSLAFYEQAFDWPRNTRIDYDEYVELHTPGGGTLGLYDRKGYEAMVGSKVAEPSGGRVSPAYVYIRVDDARGAADRIEAAGGRSLSPLRPHSWGETAAWFADPDGNVIAVAEHT